MMAQWKRLSHVVKNLELHHAMALLETPFKNKRKRINAILYEGDEKQSDSQPTVTI